MTDAFKTHQQHLPFSKNGEKALEDWLKSIDGIESRRNNGVVEFYLGVDAEPKRRIDSPLPSPPRKTPRTTVTPEPRFNGEEVTSTTLKTKTRINQQPRPVRQRNIQYKIVS